MELASRGQVEYNMCLYFIFIFVERSGYSASCNMYNTYRTIYNWVSINNASHLCCCVGPPTKLK